MIRNITFLLKILTEYPQKKTGKLLPMRVTGIFDGALLLHSFLSYKESPYKPDVFSALIYLSE